MIYFPSQDRPSRSAMPTSAASCAAASIQNPKSKIQNGNLFPNVRQQRHGTRTLDSRRDPPLVFRRNSRDTTRHDLATLRNELPQKLDIFPIHIVRHDLSRTTSLVASRCLIAELLFAAGHDIPFTYS